MKNILIYPAGSSDACRYAAGFLANAKIPLVDHPTPEVTHVLLDIPTDAEVAAKLLPMLPSNVIAVGGNIPDALSQNHKTVDLLKLEAYLAPNAAITADCALRVALPQLKTTLADSPALVIGWGRIGKCLAQLLRAVGCPVTVAVRKGKDLATLLSLGYDAVEVTRIPDILTRFRLIFNTAPEPVLSAQQLSLCGNCVKIDLASSPGLLGEDVIRARGLPGKYVPESSGRLIAETLLHYIKEGS